MSVLPSPSIQLARSLKSNMDDLHTMSAYQLFQTQMESGSTEAAVDAMKRLSVVAAAMTAAEVADRLLPYLTALALKQPPHPDELLLLLGQQLPAVASMLGPKRTTEFLPMLERLAAVEETVVRDQAVAVLRELCETVASTTTATSASPAGAAAAGGSPGGGGGGEGGAAASGIAGIPTSEVTPWMGLAKRLAAADWFTAKVSATGVVAPVLGLVNAKVGGGAGAAAAAVGSDAAAAAAAAVPPAPGSHQDLCLELLSLYKDLCQDDTPMVRRAAARHLGAVLKQAGWHHREFCAAVLPALTRDEQDSVRQLAVASLADAGTSFGEHPVWTVQYWLPVVKEGSTDMSWRVRHNLAKHFSEAAANLGIQHCESRRFLSEQSLVMACFVSLLTDTEAEVRAAATGHLARMVAWGGQQQFQQHLQPLLPALADDVVMEVRSKCALALMDAAHGGSLEDAVILQSFGPLLESFLQDEFHEVQLQVLTNLHKISRLLPALSGVVSALLQMSKAANWRVREAVALLLPHLAEARGLEFFVSVLQEPAWLTLLLDGVASVRQAIVSGMPLLVRVAGPDWILQNLLPQHVRIFNAHHSSYLVRTTVLRAHVETAVAAAPATALWNDVVLQVLRCLSDKVANVRMVAAAGLTRILPAAAAEGGVGGAGAGSDAAGAAAAFIQAQVAPALEKKLAEEEDEDVRRACQQAWDMLK